MDALVVRASASQSVDMGFIPLVELYRKTLKMVFTASLLSTKKGIVWRTSRQACLLYPWTRYLTGRLHFYVADRWPTRTSPDYNCEVANPACYKRRLLGTHQWQSASLVVGYESLTTGSKWAAIFPLA